MISPSGKSVSEIKDQEEFDETVGKYMLNPADLEPPESGYFSDGKVILIYDGEIDSCKPHLRFNKTLSAVDVSEIRVKVTVHYDDVPGGGTDCDSTISHPYSIFHIKTRKELGL